MKTLPERKKIQSINPYTEEVMREFALMTPDDAGHHVRKSREAFGAWRNLSIPERAALIGKLGTHLREEKRKYGEIITQEMGKPIRESVSEMEKCAGLCEYISEDPARFLSPEEVRTDAKKSYILFQPLGIILGIMPWNFPFWQAIRFGIPASIAGNVVLLKHASNVPSCALAIEGAFQEAGFPDHIMKTLLIDSRTALKLIDADVVDGVSLTGSNKAGEEVGGHAGKRIKKFVMELGGSDPFIVLDDAEIEKVGKTAAKARMINAGQSCIAAKRFIIMESIAEEFRHYFIRQLHELRIGDPMDETTEVGPMAKKEILRSLTAQLRDARSKGGEIIQVPHSFKKGFFFSPCAVLNPTKEMKILTEEVFGPIAPIIIVKNEDEAIRAANDTQFGLGASIWTRNLDRAERIAARIETGMVAINDIVKSDPHLPFGGVKKSGVGRELSAYGMKEFVNIKSVVVREG